VHPRTLLALLALAYLPAASRADDAPIAVAVLGVNAPNTALRPAADNVDSLLGTYLTTQDGLFLVERQQLDAVLGEQSLGASGLVEPDSAARIGKLTGAKVLVMSRLFTQGNDLMLVSKVMGTETGRVYAQANAIPQGSAQNAALKAFAASLGNLIIKHRAELIARVETPEDRIARLSKVMEGRKPPVVSVAIAEQHITHTIIDPAAETEVELILGKLGFPILAGSSADAPAYRITGEAISEEATRVGSFVSCRGRVEIKLVEVSTGRVVLADRQVVVAVDLAESVAAKTALQQSAAILTDRIVAAIAAQK
jgi:Curli production assembly/transport component CsgG